MAPHDTNSKGFFESNTITLLNDAILASAGITWFDQNRFPGSWYSSQKAPEFKEQARAALNDEFGASGLFVLKDPRHCRLVPFWEDVFTEQGVQPVYICIHRNPIEVAASLQKWHGTELLYGQLLWLRHVFDAEITTRGKKRVFVSYHQMLSDWRDVVGNISNNLDLVFPRSLATAARGVHKFLSGDLRHFSSVSLTTRDLGETSDWLMETWEVLNRWSKTGEDATGQATLDNVRDAMNAASATMVNFANNILARYHETGHQSEQIAALSLALANSEETRERQSAQLNLVNAALADSEETRERQTAQLVEADAALTKSEAGLNTVKQTLHLTWLQTQTLQKDLDRSRLELFNARSMPVQNLVKYIELRALRILSSEKSPLPSKMKSRFFGSANKRDYSGDRFQDHNSSTAKNNTVESVFLKHGQVSYRPDMPTVIIVTHDSSRTGAPILALNLAKSLSARYNVSTVCLRAGELVDDFQQVSTQVYIAEGANANQKYFSKILDNISARQAPAFVVVNSIESRHFLVTTEERRIPCVALFHEFASYTLPKSAFTDSFYLADEIVFSTELTLQNALEQTSFVRTPRFHVLAQGRCVVPRRETGEVLRQNERDLLAARLRPDAAKSSGFLVIGAGTVQIRKGVDLFIDVARRVLSMKEGENARFAWIGGGYYPDRDAAYSVFIKDQIDRARLADRMVMLEETSEIEHAYQLSNLFLLSSRLDPLPNVAIDALSEGLPVVCFDNTTGIADVLTDAGLRDACVADYLDTEQAAEKVLRFIRSPELYQQVCDDSKDTARRVFDFGAYAARIEELGLGVRKAESCRPEEIATIAASKDFDCDFMMPNHVKGASKLEAAEYFVARNWREVAPRRPEPGFNTLTYATALQSKGGSRRESYSTFIQQGRPDGHWLRSVIRESSGTALPEGTAPLKTALHIHAFYPDVIATIAKRLALNKTRPDLFISAGNQKCFDAAVEIFSGYRGRIAEARVVMNRGRDIGPLLTEFGGQLVRDYDLIGHVHTKKSIILSDRSMADRWVNFLFENVIGGMYSGVMIDRIVAAFTLNERLGIVFPSDPNIMGWSNNRTAAQKLAPRLGIKQLPEFFDFPIGTMFWTRAVALQPFVDLDLGWEDYPPEPVGIDGTVLHALERLFGVLAECKGLEIAVTNVKGITR